MSDNQVQTLVHTAISESQLSRDFIDQINQLHPAEIGDLLESLPVEQRKKVWQVILPGLKGEILLEVRDEVRDQLIKATSADDLVDAVRQLQIDEIADLEQKLPRNVVDAVVSLMDRQQQVRYQTVTHYPDETAGGLMDVDAIAIRSDITTFVALRYLRYLRKRNQNQLPEHLDSIYVVDNDNTYMGVVALKDLASMPQNTLIKNITNTDIKPVEVTTSAKKVAQIFEDLDLLSAAVVDENQKLIGRITVDDVIDVIRQQGEHMMMTPAGLNEKTDVFAPVLNSVKYRTVWLLINLFNAFIAALTINLFTDSIEKIVSLAVLMPVVTSMGGVVGNQTLTLVTRGIALEQVTKENVANLLLKEACVGILNGLFWATVVGLIVIFWMHNVALAFVCALAMLICLFLSACAGTLIPLILEKLNIDPALGGSVILVAVTDVLGFFIFLGIATFVLLS